MTENLAGRGEGLAGLCDALNRHYWRDGKGCLCGWWAGDYNTWLEHMIPILAALEAAAPPGTGPHDVHWAIKAQCAHCVDGYPQRQAGDGYISNLGPVSDGEWFHHGMVHSSSGVVECAAQYIHEALRRAALATPSPQASDSRVQCMTCGAIFVEHARPCPKCGGKSIHHTVYNDHERAAATQEQPAGSGALETWLAAQRVTLSERQLDAVKGYIVMNLLPAGSPRKVGEDAPGDTLWQRCLSLVERCRDKTPAKWDFAHELAELCKEYAALRSSSVPVGEQKQEDGV